MMTMYGVDVGIQNCRSCIMKTNISDFKKYKDFLVCVDSDGCAIDTMDEKHKKFFGPKAIETWELGKIEEEFLNTWNMVNLYSRTRGINRFKGLVKTFQILENKGFNMPPYDSILQWTETTSELSNPSLEREIEKSQNEELLNTLRWSHSVNDAIAKKPGESKAFNGVKECLEYISNIADIVIVSSANGEAVRKEWTLNGLSPYVQIMLGQEAGSKSFCIKALKKNYEDGKVLMIGDAPGDLIAAKKNKVLFYPILAGKEEFSWKRLGSEAIQLFINGLYKGEYEENLIEEFYSILK